MTPMTFWLGRGAAFAAFACVLALSWGLFGASTSPGQVRVKAYVAALDRHLRFLRSRRTGLQIVALQGASLLLLRRGRATRGKTSSFVRPVRSLCTQGTSGGESR